MREKIGYIDVSLLTKILDYDHVSYLSSCVVVPSGLRSFHIAKSPAGVEPASQNLSREECVWFEPTL
jgi:hypothetical protein